MCTKSQKDDNITNFSFAQILINNTASHVYRATMVTKGLPWLIVSCPVLLTLRNRF